MMSWIDILIPAWTLKRFKTWFEKKTLQKSLTCPTFFPNILEIQKLREILGLSPFEMSWFLYKKECNLLEFMAKHDTKPSPFQKLIDKPIWLIHCKATWFHRSRALCHSASTLQVIWVKFVWGSISSRVYLWITINANTLDYANSPHLYRESSFKFIVFP